MEFRYFTEEDYPKLVEWWKFWRFPAPGLDNLSDIGIICSIDGIDVCCGWLYITNSNMCLIEFIISNPSVRDNGIRSTAIMGVIDELSISAKEMGYQIAYTTLTNKNLQKKYMDCGFVEGSVNCNEYIKIL